MDARPKVKERVLNALRGLAAGESLSLAQLALRADTTEDSTRRACRQLVAESWPVVRTRAGYQLSFDERAVRREAAKLIQQGETLFAKAHALLKLKGPR